MKKEWQHTAHNERFRKMAALPRVDNFFLFSRRVLALKGADEPPLREAAGRCTQPPYKNFPILREKNTPK